MRLIRLLVRILRKYGSSAILIFLTLQIISICWESWEMGMPVWFVTRHRLTLNNGIKDKYFTIKHLIDTDTNYATYRVRLQMEYEEMMTALEFDFDSHFDKLESLNSSSIVLDDSLENVVQNTINTMNSLQLEFHHPERVITNQGKVVIWETLFKDDPYEVLTKEKLLNFMNFHSYFLKDIQMKHKSVISILPKEEPTFYKGSGYVYLGGGQYSWLTLLSIQALRKSGAKLPVEVIIPSKKEYDSLLCDEIFPTLGAKCIVLPKFNLDIKGYQLKPLAILFSSFERAFYLDSDVLPTMNPERYFKSRLFLDYGMITWPDFWRRTTSPLLYDALEIPLTETPVRFLNDFYTPLKYQYKSFDNVNFHDLGGTLPEWSTESGLLLVNKLSHFNVVLLALYYNLNGPTGFYPLLSQGGAGEGDKETWALAAHYLKQPWWQVQTKPRKLYGTWIKDRNWIVDSSIVQVDLLDDYEGLLGLIWGQDIWRKEMVEQVGEDQFVYNYGYCIGDESWEYASALGATLGFGNYGLSADKDVWEPMGEPVSNIKTVKRPLDAFYHIHSPKLDPWEYILNDKFTDKEKNQMRNFGEVEWLSLGWDLELWIWKQIEENLCSDSSITKAVRSLKVFENRNFDKICGKTLQKRIEWLKKDGEDKLKSHSKVEKGWKLKDTTRLMVDARVSKCRLDNI